jgi:protein-tyrosine kinase
MERIKQAVERARSERLRGADAKITPLDTAAAESQRSSEPVDRPLSEVSVSYRQTTVIRAEGVHLRDHRIIGMAEHDPAASPYKVLRTHVLQRMRVNGWKTAAITSPGDGNGKTVTAINLAISLARDVKQTVLLVDLDLRRPSIARYFFDHAVPGLSDYITEDRPLSELLINPGIERLVLLPGHHSFTHSSEVLCSPKMIELVQELKSRYEDRLILFDMPPVLASDDVIAFLPYLDAVMLVIEEGRTTEDELTRAYELLSKDKILGTVLNKSGETAAVTGYY